MPLNTKRKPSTSATEPSPTPKRARIEPRPSGQSTTPLPSHDSLLAELKPKYDVHTSFVISSTKIKNRVQWLLQHLRKENPRVSNLVLLHARPADVNKLITITEQIKRIVSAANGTWYQYNMLYVVVPKPEGKNTKGKSSHEGQSDEETDGSEIDDFEVMSGHLESAINPQPIAKSTMSLSIFISLVPIPELKIKDSVTLQTNNEQSGTNP
jgi:hypothetical protein